MWGGGGVVVLRFRPLIQDLQLRLHSIAKEVRLKRLTSCTEPQDGCGHGHDRKTTSISFSSFAAVSP